MCSTFAAQPAIDVGGGGGCLKILCNKMASFPLLKRYVFYHKPMEVKEDAQE